MPLPLKPLCGKTLWEKLATVGKGTMHIIQLSNPACLCKRVAIELAELVSGISGLVQLISGFRALGAHVIGARGAHIISVSSQSSCLSVELSGLVSVGAFKARVYRWALGAHIHQSFRSSNLSMSCQSSNLLVSSGGSGAVWALLARTQQSKLATCTINIGGKINYFLCHWCWINIQRHSI